MDCAKIVDSFSAYLDNRMTDAQKEEFLAHLAECPACRQEFDVWQAMSALFANLPQPELPANFSSSLHEKLLEAQKEMIAEEKNVLPFAEKKKNMKSSIPWSRFGSIAAALFLLVGVTWFATDKIWNQEKQNPNLLAESSFSAEGKPDIATNDLLPQNEGEEPSASSGDELGTSYGEIDKDGMKFASLDDATKQFVYSNALGRSADGHPIIAYRGEYEGAEEKDESEVTEKILPVYEVTKATVNLPEADSQVVITKAYELAKQPGIKLLRILSDNNEQLNGIVMVVPKDSLNTFLGEWNGFSPDVKHEIAKADISSEYNDLITQKESLQASNVPEDDSRMQEILLKLKSFNEQLEQVEVMIQFH